MAQDEVDKRTLLVLLESVRAAEDRLRDYYRDNQDGSPETSHLFRSQYGGARRLKEYLQRCADNFRRPMGLQLSDEDRNLLASCLVDAIPELDMKLSSRRTKREERPWLEERRALLVSMTRRLMTAQLEPLVTMRSLTRRTPTVKALLTTLPGNSGPLVFGDIRIGGQKVEEGPSKGPPAAASTGSKAASSSMRTRPDPASAGPEEPPDSALRHPGRLHRPKRRSAESGSGARPARPRPDAASPEAADRPSHRPAPEQATPSPAPVRSVDLLFDPNLVRDHRVRSQVRIDLQQLARSLDTKDLRMSLVHLGSIFEGLLLDHGLQRRGELALHEAPDKWDFHALAVRILGSKLDPGREPVLGLLRACRRLLRPACQFVHPIVVTGPMVRDAIGLIRWVLIELGFGSPRPTEPRGEPPRPEMPSAGGLWRATRRGS